MSGTDHHHDHDAHAEVGSGARPGYYDMMETAIRELLVEKKLIGADEIRRQIEVLDSRTPALGAKVVARAWVESRLPPPLAGARPRRLRAGIRHHLL